MDSEDVFAPPKAQLSDPINDASKGLQLATKSDRFLAFIIDAGIGLVVSLPFLYYMGFWEKSTELTLTIFDSLVIVVFGLVMYLVLHGNFLAKYGQTIGKRLLKIKIVDRESEQILPLWKVFSVRYLPQTLVFQIPVIGSIIGLVDGLFIFREDRRCLHDYLAETIVVEVPKH
ncbi:RDD family protein [Leucothrix arctica]|uniref:RDD family protein n=1 Tax=Leucothrix arctica TaxID=1481894 RepID=A0A317CHG2_9GAMM|nr:RDD family protein [Leucothrix arctica]PWQ97571.1 RDD family protein [Leucothrix arctica]